MIETVKSLLFRREGGVVYECRHCGTSVRTAETECPTCGSDDIVRFATQ